jgi:hypothetical protein
MKHLRFTTLLFLIVCLIVLLSPSSSAQSTQQPLAQTPSLSPSAPQQPGDASVNSQPPSQAPAADSKSTPSQPRFKIRYLPRPKDPLKLLPDPPLVPGVSGRRVANLSDSASPERQSEHSVDPGIFLRRGAGNFCGSIVSYNFSRGDNPQLESVTTCTPADAIVTRRAQGQDKKPSAPLLRTTVLSMQPQ